MVKKTQKNTVWEKTATSVVLACDIFWFILFRFPKQNFLVLPVTVRLES